MAKKKKLTPAEQYLVEIAKGIICTDDVMRKHMIRRAAILVCGPKKAHLYYEGVRITMLDVFDVLEKWDEHGMPEEVRPQTLAFFWAMFLPS